MLRFFLIFLFGLAVGSFLNVVICRLETGEHFLFGRSHCRRCGKTLVWRDLVPILSFAFLRGQCRYCHTKISIQYPLVELAAGLLSVAVFYLFRDLPVAGYQLLIIYFLIVIFVYDLKHYLIPDKVVFPAIGVSIIFRFFEFSYFLAALAAAAFFMLIVLISRGRGMGLGDVKLAFLMGLILGWPNIAFALFLAFFFGALIGVSLVLLGKKSFKSEIPFGPFLAAATVLAMIFGNMLSFSDLFLVLNFL